MYISNGIAYAGEQEPVIKVCAFARWLVTSYGCDLRLERQSF